MTTKARITALLELHGCEWSDLAIREAIRVTASKLYPALFALESAGVIEGHWVDGPAPRARRYRLVAVPVPPRPIPELMR
jgi:DNA-binding PadR family transcriptional regulator